MNRKDLRKLQLVLIFTFIVLAVFLNLWTFQPSSTSITGKQTFGGFGDDGDECISGFCESDCTNDIDDDFDGKIDCADSDCDGKYVLSGYCEYGTETSCTDDFDNDRDGCKDTIDSDCGGDEKICGDNKDNDCDGEIDCSDSDCSDSSYCLSPEICDSVGDENHNGFADCADSACDGKTGPDGQTCEFGKELSCNDDYDNDGDATIDEYDSDCPESICNDGLDNDLDGRVDCADIDCDDRKGNCAGDNSCTPFYCEPGGEKTCDDGFDNDGDGLVDCADNSRCISGGLCGEINCTDFLDNDYNGLVDCCDPDCASDPGCVDLPPCKDNEDICEGKICNICPDGSSYCDPFCRRTRGCTAGYLCQEDGTCKKTSVCTSDEECKPFVCWDGTCLESCFNDNSCYQGTSSRFFCNMETGECIEELNAVISDLPYTTYPVGYEIQFNASESYGEISSYSWTFGDGDTSSSKAPKHSYSEVGTYTITLTVSNNIDQDITKKNLTINRGEPSAIIVSPKNNRYKPGESIIFKHDSVDLDGKLTKVEWTLGIRKYPWGIIVEYPKGTLSCRSKKDPKVYCLSNYAYDGKKALGYPCSCSSDNVYKYNNITTSNVSQTFVKSYATLDQCNYGNLITGSCKITLTVTDNDGKTATDSTFFNLTEYSDKDSTINVTNISYLDFQCNKYFNNSHFCRTGETDVVYQVEPFGCCCDNTYKVSSSSGKISCVKKVSTSTTDKDKKDVGTSTFGRIFRRVDDDEDSSDEVEDEGAGSIFMIILIIVFIVVILVAVFLVWKFYLKPKKIRDKLNKLSNPAAGKPPSRMPATIPGSPQPVKPQPMPAQQQAQKPRTKKPYPSHLKKSLSELAKKYSGPKVGTKPSGSAAKPSGTTKQLPAKQPAATNVLKKPLERLSKPKKLSKESKKSSEES